MMRPHTYPKRKMNFKWTPIKFIVAGFMGFGCLMLLRGMLAQDQDMTIGGLGTIAVFGVMFLALNVDSFFGK